MSNQTIEDICEVCDQVYAGTADAEAALGYQYGGGSCNENSLKMYFWIYRCMMDGQTFKRATSVEMIQVFLTKIHEKYGKEKLKNALKATYGFIQYFYKGNGQKLQGIRKMCQKVADQYQIDMKFDDSMFQNAAVEKEKTEKVHLCWYVGAYYGDSGDQSDDFINKGVWVNGYDDKYTDLVKQIQIGDRIAMKATFTQKNNLPFQTDGTTVSAMKIKAVGVVTKNHHDGKTLEVDWKKLNPPKRWYFFTGWGTVWKVEAEADNWMYQALLDFTFLNKPQDYSKFLEAGYQGELPDEPEVEPSEKDCPLYSKEDFLSDVFMEEESYDTLKALLLRKKNLVLQGAPGVGKTYAAKRLAWSVMGEKDESRICFVQFHQSYSYEDFVMGYRPDHGGFTLKPGVFYRFCKQAEQDPNNPHFFIIDEINRGNLSKIFGELLMLIECDKRGMKIDLTYGGDPFSVPDNLYLIGMMNTADRSLAIIDYALRRRFCFFELEPAFTQESFQTYLKKSRVSEDLCETIIRHMTALNAEIAGDPNLGKGFRIGHSYFCDCRDCSEHWYRNIITYEIAPLLREYWFDDGEKAEALIDKLLG